MGTRSVSFLAILVLCLAGVASAGQTELPFAIEGPPPVLPERIARDDAGRATIRAIRLSEPLRVDGRLDETVYERERAVSDFVQTEPDEGGPATEKTELWIMFDDDNVYVAFRVFESQPERRVANVMQKDNGLLFQNDGVMFVFDPFYDRRNGVGFMLNAIGGRTDGQVTDERWSRDWNTIWDVRVADFDGGWTAEVAIPFKSLRYRPRRRPGLGIQRAPNRSLEERILAPGVGGAPGGRQRRVPHVAGSVDRGHRSAAGIEEP